MPGPKLDLLHRDQTDRISFSLSFREDMLRVIPTPYGYVLELEDYPSGGELGGPALPARILQVALPANTRAGKVEVNVKATVPVGDGPIFVAPVQPLQLSRIEVPKETEFTEKFGKKRPLRQELELLKRAIPTIPRVQPPIAALYRHALEQPKPLAEILDTVQMGTVNVVNLQINPVRFRRDGQLEFVTEFEVELLYRKARGFDDDAGAIPKYAKSIRTRQKALQLTQQAQMLVINPDLVVDLSHLFPHVISELDYLIITDNRQWNTDATPGAELGDLKAVFEWLADWKELKGLKAHVVTVQEIVSGHFGNFSLCANGLAARDLQEVLRNFLKWAHLNWGVSWVLLGGDVSIIPMRQVPGASEGHVDTVATNPPPANKSHWTGTFLKMNVDNPGVWWPGSANWILTRPDTGAVIPFDAAGTSSTASPGWYYCTSNSYTTRSTAVTKFVRANGPASLLNAPLQWIYQWNHIPTDLYYSSLVGTAYDRAGLHDWDLSNNGIYGQHTNDADLDGDLYDADVSVGRAPVSTVAQAEAFVNKVIAYERFRRPDGSLLEVDDARRLTFVSSNWGGRFGCSQSATTPPGDRTYYHPGSANYSIINTKDVLEEFKCRLIAQVTETDLRYIPYNHHANTTGYGWFFANGPTDPTPSGVFLDFWFFDIEFPIPTKWVAVYGAGGDLTPQYYIFDNIGADGSMADQETLRKQMAADFPQLNLVSRLYEDEVDLPAADAAAPPIQHLTEARLRDNLNQGPGIVSLSGHGSSNGCCHLSGALASTLTNGYSTFIAFADSCLTNQFEAEDAVSEKLLYNPNGGAVGYVGNSRFSWIGVGDNFQRRFFKTLTWTRHLGMLNDIRTTMVTEATGYHRLYNKWVIFAQNLMGDPEMEIWSAAPVTLQVTHAASIFTGVQSFAVTVRKNGSPLNNATVALKINQGSVITGKTNGSGVAAININPTTTGSMAVVVTAPNCIPWLGSVEIKKKAVCGIRVICANDLTCGTAISCGAAISCGTSLTCGLRVSCGLRLTCGDAINPCANRLACQPRLGFGDGCPNITPVDIDRFKDILDQLRLPNFGELAARWDEPEIKRFVSQLPADRFKELKLLVDRIRNER